MRAPRLFLLDGLALAYRSHFAFIRRPLLNSKGEHTSALFAFANSLVKLRDEERPEYWALAWDSEEPTFRHREFPAYKATRPPMPDELVSQLEPLKELAAAFGLPLIESPGFEADDVMATLARRALEAGMEVVLVTADKDLQQLVRPGVRVLAPRGRGDEDEWIGEPEVEARWGVRPEQLRDVLALMGDKSDNVPGVPGVGEKTAAQLISEFGDLDALYRRLGEVGRPALRRKLAEHREAAYESRHLVTVRDDLTLPVSWEDLTVRPADPKALETMARRYELRRLLTWAEKARAERQRTATPATAVGTGTKPPAGTGTKPPAAAAHQATLDFPSGDEEFPAAFGPEVRVVTQLADLRALAAELKEAPKGFCVDTETTSEDPMRARLVGLGFTTGDRPAYVPLRHREGTNARWQDAVSTLAPILADAGRPKVGQHLKYDALVLRREGLPVEGLAFDTLIASYLIEPDGAHGLDHLSRVHLGVQKIPTATLLGPRAERTMDELPIARVAAYCGEDVHCTWLLRDLLAPQLEARRLDELFRDVEMRLVPVLLAMEHEGVRVDTEFLAAMSQRLGKEQVRLEAQIHEAAGGPFNVNSGPQLGAVLFEKLGLPARTRTKTGYSTSAEVLEDLAAHHALPRLVLQYRQLAKLKSTYVDALPALVHPETGRVHTQFHQTVAATGRLSSSNPGLQNIPMRTPLGREVRRAFVARPGWRLLGADYSQVELRIMAHLSGDEALRAAFAEGRDVHAETARRIFQLGSRDPSPEERAQAKVVNFGIMYGMGARSLSSQLGLTMAQAGAFIRDYFRVHAGVQRYLEETLRTARETGFVATILGRRRYLPELQSSSPRARANAERAAINTPLQGSAADLVKVAMIRIHDRLRKEARQARLILQVHDELLFELPPEEEAAVRRIAEEEMTGAIPLVVPLEVTVGTGASWYDVH